MLQERGGKGARHKPGLTHVPTVRMTEPVGSPSGGLRPTLTGPACCGPRLDAPVGECGSPPVDVNPHV